MLARFCGGPYDGLQLEDGLVERCARPLPHGSGANFICMPPRADWDAVVRGDKDPSGPFREASPVYERVLLAMGTEFRFEADSEADI